MQGIQIGRVYRHFKGDYYLVEPKQIKFEPVNIYYEALKDAIDEHEKEVSKHND